MNPTCTLTNLNTRIRSSTLYANARTPLDSIWSNFRRPPEKSHLQPQVSEKLRGSTLAANRLGGEMVDPDTKDYGKVVDGHNRLPFHAEKGLGWIAIRCDFDNVISGMLIHLTGTCQTPVRTLITFFQLQIG